MTDQPSRYWDFERCQWVRCDAPTAAEKSGETASDSSAMPEQRAVDTAAGAEAVTAR